MPKGKYGKKKPKIRVKASWKLILLHHLKSKKV